MPYYRHYPIVINENNLVQSSFNNTFEYTFPSNLDFTNWTLSFDKISIFYSWYNISNALGNNQFQLNIPHASTNALITITIPDGTYSVRQLNEFLQQSLINNNAYLINSVTGDFRYYSELIEDPTSYRIQLIQYPVPTSAPAGYTEPSGGWYNSTMPTTQSYQQLRVLDNNFGSLIGFNIGNYPAALTPATSNYSKLSDYTPQLAVIQQIYILCDILSNPLTTNNQFLTLFDTAGVSYGSLIQEKTNEYVFIETQNGPRQTLRVSFVDQNYNPINIVDTNLSLKLILREREDVEYI